MQISKDQKGGGTITKDLVQSLAGNMIGHMFGQFIKLVAQIFQNRQLLLQRSFAHDFNVQ